MAEKKKVEYVPTSLLVKLLEETLKKDKNLFTRLHYL